MSVFMQLCSSVLLVVSWLSAAPVMEQVTCDHTKGSGFFFVEDTAKCEPWSLVYDVGGKCGMTVLPNGSDLDFTKLIQGLVIQNDEVKQEVNSGNCSFVTIIETPNGARARLRGNDQGDCGFRLSYRKSAVDTVSLTGVWKASSRTVHDLVMTGGPFSAEPSPPPGPTCKPLRFRRATSNHTWVDFNLPSGSEGQQIKIPAGVRNKYVFPACHRVWWDETVYRCDVSGSWVLVRGNAGADGLCHGGLPSSPYLVTGDH